VGGATVNANKQCVTACMLVFGSSSSVKGLCNSSAIFTIAFFGPIPYQTSTDNSRTLSVVSTIDSAS